MCSNVQLQSILEQRPQIELFIDSVQHLKASEKIPKLDAEYWILTEENYALLQMFLEVNLIITVEDKPTLAPLLVSVIMLKEMLSPLSDLVRVRSRAMLMKDISERYDFDNDSRWGAESTQLMVCALALDPRFKEFASHMVTGSDDMVWTMVKDMAIQHWKFECDESVEVDGSGAEPACKRARVNSGSLMERFLTARGAAIADSRQKLSVRGYLKQEDKC